MALAEIKYCPGTLAKDYKTYSPTCLNRVFNRRKVAHILPYDPPKASEAMDEEFMENRKRFSISGVQEKLSMVLDKNKLRLAKDGEQGTYILKPIPVDLKKADQVPANEHLTMQIARQVYGINIAENALIFFKNGAPAYLTKRFDIKEDGMKWGIEDFASLASKTVETAGGGFKYDYNYESLAELLKKYVPTYLIEIEKLFTLILFNYIFSNGDAHLKNFSILELSSGDYVLSPAYDLLNTRIHVADTALALSDGLFKDDFKSMHYGKTGHPCKVDFIEFAKRVGIKENRIDKLIAPFLEKQTKVEELTTHSFLNEGAKKAYLLHYQTRCNYLNKSS